MASELFLGPDGGPYVSVNENSGDIELKDNSGNVVAFWDESNTQWDVQTNDIQNVGSLGVEDPVNSPGFLTGDSGVLSRDLDLQDGETLNLSNEFGGVLEGLLSVTKRRGDTATGVYVVDGGFGIALPIDPDNKFGTASGANDINVYEGANNDYILENSASTDDDIVSVIFIGSLS